MGQFRELNQATHIDRLNAYMQLMAERSGARVDRQKLDDIDAGICAGLSVVFSYMAAVGKLDWWCDVLAHIDGWDGTQDGLEKKVKVTGAKDDLEVPLGQLFERAFNYVLYYQGGQWLEEEIYGGDEIEQNYLSRKENQGIQRCIISGRLGISELDKLLDEETFSQKAIITIAAFSKDGGHSVHVHFDQKLKKWIYYDPNISMTVMSKANVCVALSRIMRDQQLLEIEITPIQMLGDEAVASPIDTQTLLKKFNEILLSEDGPKVFHKRTLIAALKHSPEILDGILALAEEDSLVEMQVLRYLMNARNNEIFDMAAVVRAIRDSPDAVAALEDFAEFCSEAEDELSEIYYQLMTIEASSKLIHQRMQDDHNLRQRAITLYAIPKVFGRSIRYAPEAAFALIQSLFEEAQSNRMAAKDLSRIVSGWIRANDMECETQMQCFIFTSYLIEHVQQNPPISEKCIRDGYQAAIKGYKEVNDLFNRYYDKWDPNNTALENARYLLSNFTRSPRGFFNRHDYPKEQIARVKQILSQRFETVADLIDAVNTSPVAADTSLGRRLRFIEVMQECEQLGKAKQVKTESSPVASPR